MYDEEKGPDYRMIPIADLEPNEWNPNVIDDETFNMLADDVASDLGNLQPILVVKKPDGGYRIVDGEHRYEAERLAGRIKIPCIVVPDEFSEDEDWQKFKTVRMNKLRGKTDKKRMLELLKDLTKRHAIDEIAENMGYVDPTELEVMIEKARASLKSPELRKEFDAAREEIKTVDDLSLILNKLFTKYGDKLDYHFMVLDFGGRRHIWVRFPDMLVYRKVLEKATLCADKGYTFNSVLLFLIDHLITPDFLEENKGEFEVTSSVKS